MVMIVSLLRLLGHCCSQRPPSDEGDIFIADRKVEEGIRLSLLPVVTKRGILVLIPDFNNVSSGSWLDATKEAPTLVRPDKNMERATGKNT